MIYYREAELSLKEELYRVGILLPPVGAQPGFSVIKTGEYISFRQYDNTHSIIDSITSESLVIKLDKR